MLRYLHIMWLMKNMLICASNIIVWWNFWTSSIIHSSGTITKEILTSVSFLLLKSKFDFPTSLTQYMLYFGQLWKYSEWKEGFNKLNYLSIKSSNIWCLPMPCRQHSCTCWSLSLSLSLSGLWPRKIKINRILSKKISLTFLWISVVHKLMWLAQGVLFQF